MTEKLLAERYKRYYGCIALSCHVSVPDRVPVLGVSHGPNATVDADVAWWNPQ